MGIRRTEWNDKGNIVDWQMCLYTSGKGMEWGRFHTMMESIQGQMWPRNVLKEGECEITDLAYVKRQTEVGAAKNTILIWNPNKDDLRKYNFHYAEIPYQRYEGICLEVINGNARLFTYHYTQKIDEGLEEKKDAEGYQNGGLVVNSGYRTEHEVWTNVKEEQKPKMEEEEVVIVPVEIETEKEIEKEKENEEPIDEEGRGDFE